MEDIFGNSQVNAAESAATGGAAADFNAQAAGILQNRSAFSRITVTHKQALTLLAAGAAAALLYTVCFCGAPVFPMLSFAIFCPVIFVVLALTLNAAGSLKNRRALLLIFPVTIIASFNAVFGLNPFTYGNVLVVHALFAAFVLCAVREQPMDIFSLAGIEMGLRVVLGNWLVFFRSFKPLAGGGGARGAALKKLLLGLLLAVPVLFVIIMLLASADMVFKRLIGNFFTDFSFSRVWYAVTFLLAWVYFTGYAWQGARVAKEGRARVFRDKRADVVIGATFLALLNLVFLAFTFVQCAYLFGHGLMTLPDGMAYSQYAREGFFQLLFVSVINFAVLLVFLCAFRGARESRLLRGLLLALCAFTAVLIASSFYRMFLYIGVYGHTTLRLSVITFLVMESCGLCFAAARLLSGRVPLVKSLAVLGLAFYAMVNVTGSDWFAAKLNAGMLEAGKLEYVDVGPMLGTDGLYVIKPLMESGEYVCVNVSPDRSGNYALVKNTAGAGIAVDFEELAAGNMIPGGHWQNWTYFQCKIR
ncbi:MAG: DUF4173 domain-containing protein [Defluviitaleaceae bacterium]|nr:DUF4173 domain-containing protein [Defluviitaleaceae bacterium]